VQLDLRGLVVTREAPVASVYIERLPDGSSVRTSFALGRTSSGISGNSERIVLEPEFYASFFARTDTEFAERHVSEKEILVEVNNTDNVNDTANFANR